ncbi:hypothetical protein HanXRQr2_Chr17g0785081 [Helianthus annuus]|uniref:DUF4283 domain-containing protein n=1 Tax=Helianthus annuus TaxID=4232 RepID=A0A9K3GS52_HELAN|nr:hypothetical protein HanXRQr2_Chr17g0785081 [Helianthus annuus]KAJ0431797.1 hypothetical protein HanIR_Chr17g0852291 [Helianthus annuus]KAJ0446182.1 hypothetical protein HanHA89_Chr17g0691541 [Helianthus annuus]KAJ0811652.1 hypothetical protein HanPSC8_Chr17g0753121 [Helianthus annuus]
MVEQTVIVPDRTSALLSIAKVVVANVQYLGGLTLLISFHDKDSATRFLESKSLWGPWFSRLDGWNGQSFPLERVSWLKLSGIPLHLLSSEVLAQVGELFGKVLHVPKGLEEDQDLSVCRVGVLVGEVDRINVGVSVRWKNRAYRIRVEEDLNDWVPDNLSSGALPGSGGGSSPLSSPVSTPVVDGNGSAAWGNVEMLHGDCGVGVEGSLGGGGAGPHDILSPGHADRENGGSNHDVGTGSVDVENPCLVSKAVGPEVVGNFLCGSGERKSKPTRRRRSGHSSKRAQSVSQFDKVSSPVVERPNKRPRDSVQEVAPGFGFVGFTDRAKNNHRMEDSAEEEGEVRIDLNVRANSEGSPIGQSKGFSVQEPDVGSVQEFYRVFRGRIGSHY